MDTTNTIVENLQLNCSRCGTEAVTLNGIKCIAVRRGKECKGKIQTVRVLKSINLKSVDLTEQGIGMTFMDGIYNKCKEEIKNYWIVPGLPRDEESKYQKLCPIDLIGEVVCSYTGTTLDVLRKKTDNGKISKVRKVVVVRHIIAHFCYLFDGKNPSQERVAHFVGVDRHCTISVALKTIQRDIEQNPYIARTVRLIKEELNRLTKGSFI